MFVALGDRLVGEQKLAMIDQQSAGEENATEVHDRYQADQRLTERYLAEHPEQKRKAVRWNVVDRFGGAGERQTDR